MNRLELSQMNALERPVLLFRHHVFHLNNGPRNELPKNFYFCRCFVMPIRIELPADVFQQVPKLHGLNMRPQQIIWTNGMAFVERSRAVDFLNQVDEPIVPLKNQRYVGSYSSACKEKDKVPEVLGPKTVAVSYRRMGGWHWRWWRAQDSRAANR